MKTDFKKRKKWFFSLLSILLFGGLILYFYNKIHFNEYDRRSNELHDIWENQKKYIGENEEYLINKIGDPTHKKFTVSKVYENGDFIEVDIYVHNKGENVGLKFNDIGLDSEGLSILKKRLTNKNIDQVRELLFEFRVKYTDVKIYESWEYLEQELNTGIRVNLRGGHVSSIHQVFP